jgi:hypothetical protein
MDEIDASKWMPTWHPTQKGYVTSISTTLISTLVAFHVSLMIFFRILEHF